MKWHHEWLSSFRIWLERKPRVLVGAISLMALLLVTGAGTVAWFAYDLTAGLPTAAQIRGLGEMAQSTTIFDANDTPAFTIFKEQRIEIPFERMSPNLIKAIVSVEDQRFFDHNGVDFIRVAAAAVRNLQEGRRAEGGSTITQQLARQTFLNRDKTYRRKLKEVIRGAHRAQYSERHPRLPEQGLPRRRTLRWRRRRAVTSASTRATSASTKPLLAGLIHPVELCPMVNPIVPWRGGTWCCRRWPRPAIDQAQ